jgi:hypothetical protein
LCGNIWAVCEIRTYFTFVSNWFIAFHVFVGKVVTSDKHPDIIYLTKEELRQQYICLWCCTDPLSYECGKVPFSFSSVALQPSAFLYVMIWTECYVQVEWDICLWLTWFTPRILTKIYSYHTLVYSSKWIYTEIVLS